MKNVLKQSNLPFLLLIGLILKSVLISSPIFDSVGIAVLSGLFGFKLWLDHIKKPDYNRDLEARMVMNNEKISDAISDLNKRVSSVAGNVAMSQKATQKPNFKW